jgi:hypothetical protein
LEDQNYPISLKDVQTLEWNTTEFRVVTSPIEHSLCGELSLKAYLQELAMATESEPASFDPEQLIFKFRTASEGWIGDLDYELRAWFTEYEAFVEEVREPSVTAAKIVVASPCADADILLTDLRFRDLYYYYRGDIVMNEYQLD